MQTLPCKPILSLSSLLSVCVPSLHSNLSSVHNILFLFSALQIQHRSFQSVRSYLRSFHSPRGCASSFVALAPFFSSLSFTLCVCVCVFGCGRDVCQSHNDRWHDHEARRHGRAGDPLSHRHAQEQHVPGLRAVRCVPRRKGAWWNGKETMRKPGERRTTWKLTPCRPRLCDDGDLHACLLR